MNKFLLDTHVLLWALEDSPRLSYSAREALLTINSDLVVSMASYWEICIKLTLGKLKMRPRWSSALDQFMSRNRITWLAIDRHHCREICDLPDHHRDPFDRLIIAQAKYEKRVLISADKVMNQYPISHLW